MRLYSASLPVVAIFTNPLGGYDSTKLSPSWEMSIRGNGYDLPDLYDGPILPCE